MLQHNGFFLWKVQFGRETVQGFHPLNQVAQHLPFKGVSGRNSQFIGLDFVELFHIMKNHARQHKILIQHGIYLAHALSVHQHPLDVI